MTGVPLLMAAASGMVLVRAYDDPRYLAERPDLAELRAYLSENVDEKDVLLLAAPGYVAHFANYYKGPATWYSLPPAPGERYSPDQAPEIVTDDVREQVGIPGAVLIDLFLDKGRFSRKFNQQDQPVWLVEDLTPGAHPWSNRPAEHLLLMRTYRVNATDFSDRVRLTEFLPYKHNKDGSDQPEVMMEQRFGDAIRLAGFDTVTRGRKALGDSVSPGDPVGVSLRWEALDTPDLDYTVAVFIIGPDGLPVLQQDTMPIGGFRPTNTWTGGELFYDSYGFWLPEDAQPGEYQIWLVVYDWRSGERLPVTGSDGEPIGDHAVLRTFEVRPSSSP
jgi:hypothetical protein